MDLYYGLILLFILSFHLFITFASDHSSVDTALKTYIVHVEPHESQVFTNSEDLENWYSSFLPSNTASSSEEPRIIYSYSNVIKGFAAKLSPEEVKVMEKKEGFVSASAEEVLPLHTTHTPHFLGLHQNMGFWKDSNLGKGVVIGVIDTGIFPDHPSFSDAGMPPPPAKWKGRCDFNSAACNNKLIGARSFLSGNGSPLDETGHGTHIASIAAGNFVEGANVFGLANGTAVGVAPLAHLAIYKVCDFVCSESAIIAAMETAIEDGVDVISISVGGSSRALYDDYITLGAYTAMERGIFVSCSAGNTGPSDRSLSNEAPWIMTVGASTIDRKLKATAMLGNNELFGGESAFQPHNFSSTMLPLVYPGMNPSDLNASFCFPSSLNNTDIRGKIVLCEVGGGLTRIEIGEAVRDAGGAAMILVNARTVGSTTLAEAHVVPAIHVNFEDGQKIKTYINSTVKSTTLPTATIIFKGTIIGDVHAPSVSSFSSRGPSLNSPGILKPDIIGPGVNILAAWPLSVEKTTNTKANFNILSGTSMSCPHLSGVAALLKSAHPDWSPAAIKSAIMTTADQLNVDHQPIEDQLQLQPANIFAIGAGHVNPSKANNPGLIYDIKSEDYVPYLCGLNYTDQQVSIILQRIVNCIEESSIPEAQLNYPSFSIRNGTVPQTYTRTVTNVGDPISIYTVEVVPPAGVDVKIEPSKLVFSELNQKLTYQVTFSPSILEDRNLTFSQGYLKWTSSNYSVRSPIAVISRFE